MSKARRPRRRVPALPRWNQPRFQPTHCPNRKCAFYPARPGWRYQARGFFSRKSSPLRFQRFRCLSCGRSFSVRTFAPDYWLRRRDLYLKIARLSVEGPGLRQMGRYFGVSHDTIGRHLARAGRQAMLFHLQSLSRLAPQLWRSEALVIDGFETFEFSQYFPFHLNLAVGSKSWFLYEFTDSPLRRKGRMTQAQKEKRALLEAALGRPDPKAVEKGVFRLLRSLGRRLPGRTLELQSDDHPAYRRALRRLRRGPGFSSWSHQVTSSKERRTTSNPLFPVNLADLLLRHSQANHRRETIAYSKRRQGAIERAALFAVWRNYVKRRRENRKRRTCAMEVGILSRPLRFADLFERRLFPRRKALPLPWWSYYWRRVRTRALGSRQRKHDLGYAF